jgi:hypothetical protein
MPNEFDKSGMIHQWIYVIIPVSSSSKGKEYPLFCAFCKVCRLYFTEPINYEDYYKRSDYHTREAISQSSLPRYGCMPPDDIPVI